MVDNKSRLEISPELVVEHHKLNEDYHCTVIDNFLLRPEMAVSIADHHTSEFIQAERSYPGIVYAVGQSVLSDIYRFIRFELSEPFAFLRGNIKFSAHLSLATLQPDQFTCLQRLCHSDPRTGTGRTNIAVLLYLFDDPALGGTGFYRWKEEEKILHATALEQEATNKAMPFLQENFKMFSEPPCYITGSNEVAELIHKVPAKFNRLVVYPGDMPHSAYIEQPGLLTDKVSTGRLTLNCFASVLARS
ncbi:MAG: DUF6445 family protein [bacterium]|nr:hypothetical protein [Gammaproteobacteria bacterium]HIL97892.1 hypothetical protein [Pseudomonadales bacterium]